MIQGEKKKFSRHGRVRSLLQASLKRSGSDSVGSGGVLGRPEFYHLAPLVHQVGEDVRRGVDEAHQEQSDRFHGKINWLEKPDGLFYRQRPCFMRGTYVTSKFYNTEQHMWWSWTCCLYISLPVARRKVTIWFIPFIQPLPFKFLITLASIKLN